MPGLSHFYCLYVVYEVPILLSDLFERYFNIIDGQTDRQTDSSNRLTQLYSGYARWVNMSLET